MKSALRFLVFGLLASFALVTRGAGETPDEWRSLFDGKSFTGWRGYGKTTMPSKGWRVQDGMILKVKGEQGGDIITEKTFEDFDIRWEWRIAKNGNNGLKYLVTEARSNGPGHEYQMLDDDGHPDGKRGLKRQTASFYDVLPPKKERKLNAPGEWNSSRVLLQGTHVEHWLNEEKVLEYELGSDAVKAAVAASKFKDARGFGERARGHIMLTDHGDECWFRNIRIRELPAKPAAGTNP
ncbi:MAG: hypothetical protein QOF48_3002 [Verrucomicrobiota bacterium]|jgi:hypothetical protein